MVEAIAQKAKDVMRERVKAYKNSYDAQVRRGEAMGFDFRPYLQSPESFGIDLHEGEAGGKPAAGNANAIRQHVKK